MDHNAQVVEQSDQPSRFHLGVLFIHGIGAQKRGQTLAEFGAPVYVWLKDRLNGLDRRWREAISQQALEAIKRAPEARKQTPEAIKQQFLESIKQRTPEASQQQTVLEQWRDQVGAGRLTDFTPKIDGQRPGRSPTPAC